MLRLKVLEWFLALTLFVVSGGAAGKAFAKDTPGKLAGYRFIEAPRMPLTETDADGSMFQAAVATTTLLGWWQFDNPSGGCEEQGWTKHDLTEQIKKTWHVAGLPGGCEAITPIAGTKSMWCGQWTSTLEPWCGWATLPGYGNEWDQSLESTVSNVTTVAYAIAWEAEPGYDYAYLEWWNPASSAWVADANANGGAGKYGGNGSRVENLASPYGSTQVRFHFVSDGAYSDEDGLWPTAEGAVKVDALSINGGAVEDWENEECNATQSTDGAWVATMPPGFGFYGHLVHGATLVQVDPCNRVLSCVWAFIDDPLVTNYSCGGWPFQGAVPYGPDARGLYMQNEIWSPWIPVTGSGDEFVLSFLTYRDLPLDALVFYSWRVVSRDTATGGCPPQWDDSWFVYYGGQKDWIRTNFDFGTFVPANATDIRVSLGAYDFCGPWCGIYGTGTCHSHAPIFDQVRVVRVNVSGPQWAVRYIDLWQDNFPEEGGIGPADYARCDMAQSIIPGNKKNILPGDSLKIVVTDPAGLADDNTGGRPGKAVYVFVKVTDRFGNPVAGKNGLAIQSPDNKAYAADTNAGLLRWPHVAGLAPAGWDAYRMDYTYTAAGGRLNGNFCADLMDLGSGPLGPHYKHANENVVANTGIFTPGDAINYFFAAKNTNNQWSYWHRSFRRDGWVSQMGGQGVGRSTTSVGEAIAGACEWSVLPDAGRYPGEVGDILVVDDADDRIVVNDVRIVGAPAQIYMDWALVYMGVTNSTDRFDVLGPSSCVGNSLASRVKNIANQMIGDPVEIYQQVLWNCSDLSGGLMGDGGTPNGGSGAEKSDDFGLCYTFLDMHPNNPGWAYWGDDVVQEWSLLLGPGAVNVKSKFMNHTLATGDQRNVTGVASPKVLPASPVPPAGYLQPTESFYAYGGCLSINDFDVPAQAGASRSAHRYDSATSGPAASLSQQTLNSTGTTARFFLAGFGYDFIRDDDAACIPDRFPHLKEILWWFQNVYGQPLGIDPVTIANRLDHAYPNPFNPTTTIEYSIASPGRVSLKIYNAAGQLVRTLVDEEQIPRVEGFSVVWDGAGNTGEGVASGVYFYKLAAKEFSETKKMVLLK